jgi:hypothetical protein
LPTLSQTLSTEPNLIAVPRATLEKALKVKAERDLCVEELQLTQGKVVLYSKSIDLYKVEVENLNKIITSKDLVIVEKNKVISLKEDQIKVLKREKSSKMWQGLLIGFAGGAATVTLLLAL